MCKCIRSFKVNWWKFQIQQGNRRCQTQPPYRRCLLVSQFKYTPRCQICVAPAELLWVYAYFVLPIAGHYVQRLCHHKTGSTYHIATPPEEPRSEVTGTNMVEIGHVVREICSRTDRHTNKHAAHHKSQYSATPSGGRSSHRHHIPADEVTSVVSALLIGLWHRRRKRSRRLDNCIVVYNITIPCKSRIWLIFQTTRKETDLDQGSRTDQPRNRPC